MAFAVLVVDDDAIVRHWIRTSLGGTEFRIVGEARSAAEALRLVVRRAPHLLLVDNRLPDASGPHIVRELRRLGIAAFAVVMSARQEAGLNERAREAGCQGTLLKTASVRELLEAMRAVSAGGTSFDSRHPRRALGRAHLTFREREVLRLVAEGNTNKEIAAELGVGAETVKTILARAFLKLGAKRRAEAVAIARNLGFL